MDIRSFFGDDSVYWDVPTGPASAAKGPDGIEARLRLGLEGLAGYEHDHLRSVAEGVETRPQFVAVRELGFDRAQGYLFGRPVPAPSISARLALRSQTRREAPQSVS